MDYKTAYSQSVKIAKEIAEEEDELQRKISSGVHRKQVFGANWQAININEVVERLTPNAKTVRLSGKIYYNGDDGHYAIIADIGGGYLRIMDLHKNEYVGIDGQSMHNYTDSNGKQHGRNKADFNAVTHFRIKKREDM